MKRLGLVLGVGVAAVVLWAGVAAQQEVRPRPGFGSGIMDVNVVNHPAVTAAQSGPWHVAVSNAPDVRVTNVATVAVVSPSFLRVGLSYVVTWRAGETETVTISEIAYNGWVRVQTAGRTRWVNLSTARAVEEGR
ncbi:MAG TPA: hypothetical protein VM364_04600 [Vicinamibacterales bacterium]|nr:hypothetical protein [Vicinamibacterales bacterium]